MGKRILFIYNNIGKPYFLIKTYDKNELLSEKVLNLKEDQLEKGLPVNYDILVNFIEESKVEEGNITLLLNCNEIFSIATRMPKIPQDKANQLVKKELLANYPDLKERYYSSTLVYSDKLGYIFYNYFVPQRLTRYFEKVGFLAKKKIRTFDSYINFITSTVDIKDEEYCLFYNEQEVTNIILRFKNRVYVSTTLKHDEKNVVESYLKLSAKHQYDLEKITINKIYSNIVVGEINESSENKTLFLPEFKLDKYEGRRI